jgi:chromodomain-helicase-DNA-binding protein 7
VDKLRFEVEVDHLYLVKWKGLSYLEATWEKESNIVGTGKVLEFRMFNRSLDKDSRVLMQ